MTRTRKELNRQLEQALEPVRQAWIAGEEYPFSAPDAHIVAIIRDADERDGVVLLGGFYLTAGVTPHKAEYRALCRKLEDIALDYAQQAGAAGRMQVEVKLSLDNARKFRHRLDINISFSLW